MGHSQDLKYIEKEIIINASAHTVWEVLKKLDLWREWNPFIIQSEGEIKVGNRLKNVMKNGDKTFTFKPKVLAVEAKKGFEWKGHLLVPGIFDGKHGFRIEVMGPDQVRFVNYENFSGLLSKMIMKKIYADTATNFDRMNQALKARVEEILLSKSG